MANLSWAQGIVENHPNVATAVHAIEGDSLLRSVVLTNEEFMDHVDEGGELTGYFRDSLLVKISVALYFSHGQVRMHYYLDQGELILMEESFDQYGYDVELNEMDYATTERTFHGQYVFSQGQLIDQISRGHNRFENDETDVQGTILSEFKHYKDLIHRKKEE